MGKKALACRSLVPPESTHGVYDLLGIRVRLISTVAVLGTSCPWDRKDNTPSQGLRDFDPAYEPLGRSIAPETIGASQRSVSEPPGKRTQNSSRWRRARS